MCSCESHHPAAAVRPSGGLDAGRVRPAPQRAGATRALARVRPALQPASSSRSRSSSAASW
eukprot:14704456-Alexandrium_andersonii.AAC.1